MKSEKRPILEGLSDLKCGKFDFRRYGKTIHGHFGKGEFLQIIISENRSLRKMGHLEIDHLEIDRKLEISHLS